MNNIFKDMGERLHRKCDNLSPARRKQVLIIISVIYLLLTAIVVISAFLPSGSRTERDNFNELIKNNIQQDTLAMPDLMQEETTNMTDYE